MILCTSECFLEYTCEKFKYCPSRVKPSWGLVSADKKGMESNGTMVLTSELGPSEGGPFRIYIFLVLVLVLVQHLRTKIWKIQHLSDDL